MLWALGDRLWLLVQRRAVRPPCGERLKAHQKEKNQDGQNDSSQTTSGGRNLSAPVSKREATRRKKALMPQKSGSSSDRGQEAFQ